MKILHVDLGKEMRGGQYQVLLLMKTLAGRGHQQALVAREGSPLEGAARRMGLTIAEGFPAGSFDVVHAHDADGHTRAVLRAGSTPVVVSRRVAFPVRRGMLSKLKYRRAAHYLAVSEYVHQELLAAGIPKEKITVVLDGVVLPDLSEAAERRDRFRDRNRLAAADLVAGSLPPPPEKPGGLLIQTAAHLPEIKALITAPQDLSDFLFAIDIFVYLSESEGLGSGILLAMAHGLPVIASRSGGIPEIVHEGKTGLLVSNTEEELRAALHRLVIDAPLRRALGTAAREWVARHATDAIMAARTEAVYRKVMRSRR